MAEPPVVLVSRHLPLRHGTAAGRALWALRTGLVALGCDVTVWSWRPGPPAGTTDLPSGCHAVVLPSRPPWRLRATALVRPRQDSALLAVDVPDGAIVVADDPVSWPAVARTGRPIVTVHHAVRLDALATGRRDLALVQDLRLERRVARVPALEVLSARVGRAVGRPSAPVVPIATPVPADDEVLPAVDGPVACLLADWEWAPNLVALDRLLRCWPEVRRRVTGARLVVAGRGDPRIGTVTGVEWRGEVADSRDVLADAVAVAFPCPASSGPKVKSLEALVHGRALVTTRAGLEGLHLVGPPREGPFVDLLADTLSDPGRAQQRGRAAAEAVRRAHGPVGAARARLDRWRAQGAGPTR